MINIAAIVKDLGPSQQSFYLIKKFNELSRDPNFSCSAFVANLGVPVTKPLFSCSSVSFFSDYIGTAIATNLEEADILLKSNNNCKKYLYLWDLEWLVRPMNFTQVCNILRDDRLKIIARSKSHADIINNFCNKEVIGIVEDWNNEQLLEIMEKEKCLT
tara:strand:+ start:112 stop:588 length:477 start_codon:yes stop_codon:yes gene_type:complete